jgi:hypothetical protein
MYRYGRFFEVSFILPFYLADINDHLEERFLSYFLRTETLPMNNQPVCF